MAVEGLNFVYVPNNGVYSAPSNPYNGKGNVKPGLIFPEKKENKTNTAVKVAGLTAAAVLAYVFRGKIKTGANGLLNKLKATGIIDKTKNVLQKGVDVVKPYIDKAWTAIKNTKVVKYFTK